MHFLITLISDTIDDLLLDKASELISFEIVDHSLLLTTHFSHDTLLSVSPGLFSSQTTLFLKKKKNIFAGSLQGYVSSLSSGSVCCTYDCLVFTQMNCNDGPFVFGVLIF